MAGDKSQSILKDQALRKELSWAICQKINELLGLKDDKKLTEDDVDKWMNNELVTKKFNVCYDKFTNAKNNNFYRPVIDTSNINTLEKQDRIASIYFKNGKSDEVKKYNKDLVLKSSDKDTKIELCQDKMIDLMNSDLSKQYPDSDEESLDYIASNNDDMFTGMNINYINDKTYNENPELTDRYKEMKSVLESSNVFTNYKIWSNPFYYLIPQGKLTAEDYVNLSLHRNDIDEVIKKCAPNIKEIEVDVQGNEDFRHDFGQWCSDAPLMGMKEKSKGFYDLKKLGLLDKGVPFNNIFKIGDKIVPLQDLPKYIKDGELPKDFKMESRSEESNQRLNDAREKIYLKSSIASLKKYIKDIEPFQRLSEENTLLYQDASRIVSAYGNGKIEIEKFLQDNGNKLIELNHVFSLKSEKLEELHRHAKNLKDGISNQEASFKKFNYKSLASRAGSYSFETKIDIYKPEFISNEKLDALSKGFVRNYAEVKALKEKYIKPLSQETVRDAISLLKVIGDKDRTYNNSRGFFHWWYTKSHEKMLAEKNTLIYNLTRHGISRDLLEGVVNGQIEDLPSVAAMAIEKKNINRDEYNKTVDDIYDKYIGKNTEKIEELEAEVIKSNAEIVAKKEKIELNRENIYQKYDPTFKMINYRKLSMDGRNDFIAKFKEWYHNQNDENLIKEYDSIINEQKELNKMRADVKKVEQEIRLRLKDIEKGNAFKENVFERTELDLSIQERINNDLNPESEKVKGDLKNDYQKNKVQEITTDNQKNLG